MSEVEWQVNELGNLAPCWEKALSLNQVHSICQTLNLREGIAGKTSLILMTVFCKMSVLNGHEAVTGTWHRSAMPGNRGPGRAPLRHFSPHLN